MQTARMPHGDDLISTKEATDLLGYANPSSVVRMVWEGRLIPVHKLGGKNGAYLFKRSDVEAIASVRSEIAALLAQTQTGAA